MVLATEEQLLDKVATNVDDDGDAAPYPLSKEVTFFEERTKSYLPVINLVVLVGLKGSTKTCNLVRLMLHAMAKWHRPVFSDFPMSGDQLGHHFESQPFPDDAFVTYCKNIPPNACVFVDEFQEFFDRQNWMSVESKLGTSVFQQIRKLGLTIFGATQFFNYINPRINDQVDILVRCQDMKYTPWGINEQIERGKEAYLEWYDLCGAIKGVSARNPRNPHWVTGEPYYEELVFTKPYWKFFDTRRMTAIENRFRRYIVKKETRAVPGVGQVGVNQNIQPEENKVRDAILDIVAVLKQKGDKEVKSGDLFNMLKNNGFNVNRQQMGYMMRNMGFEVKGEKSHHVYYPFPEEETQ